MQAPEETVWMRRDCVSADVDDTLVLLDLDTLVYHSLNRTASAIWNALEEPSTASAVAARLEQRFAVDPQHCRQSVAGLIALLQQKQLVSPIPAGEPVLQ